MFIGFRGICGYETRGPCFGTSIAWRFHEIAGQNINISIL